MEVVIVGGFLGSGKTTTVINMGKYLAEKGKKVAIIVNEIGEIGIDGDVVKKFGFDTKEITNGCICCTLKVGLKTAVNAIMKEYEPDILMIEPTGIAFPSSIKNEFKLMNLSEEVKVAPLVTLIDGSRFKHLMKEAKNFAIRQIVDAEILGINKVDLMDKLETPILEVSIQQLNPGARVVLLSGKDTGKRFENFMQMVLPGNMEITEKINTAEEKTEIKAQEYESSIAASRVGSYAAEFLIESKEAVSRETAREITTQVMSKIKEKALELNPEFLGHIKLFLDNGSETVKQSITIYYEEPQEDIFKSKEGTAPKFKVLSAVLNIEKEAIKSAVSSSVHEVFESMGIGVHKVKHSHTHDHEHGHHYGHDEEHNCHHEHDHHCRHEHGHDEEHGCYHEHRVDGINEHRVDEIHEYQRLCDYQRSHRVK
jgi:G3E family GTPase